MPEHNSKSIDPRESTLSSPQTILKDGRGVILWVSSNPQHRVLNQKEGLQTLGRYLSGDTFEYLKPFMIDSLSGGTKRPNSFYLGIIDGKEVYTTLNPQMTEAIQIGKSILAVPKRDDQNYYQWLDFYSVDKDTVDTDQILGSYRLDLENKRIINKGWYGYERQLFIDFVTGSRDLHPSELKPFTTTSTRFQTVTFGYQSQKPILIKIAELEPKAGQQVSFVPKFDEQRGYIWVDGYLNKNGSQVMICSRRINLGVSNFSESIWKGPQVQTMIEWINGRLPLNLTEPLRYLLEDTPARIALEASTESQIVFSLQNNPSFEGAKEILLIPKQDELYQWVEVHRDDETTEGGYKLANYYRVTPGEKNKLQSSWMGPDEQRYFDYLEGKLDFSNLREINLLTQAHAIVSLFTFKGKHLSLQLNDLENFPKGKEVRVIPSLSTNGNLILEVTKASTDIVAKKFVYDLQTNSFRVANEQGEVIGKPTRYWTTENTELEVRAFYEQEGSLGFLKKRRNDLYIAARKYPGGIKALERKLNLKSLPQVDKESGVYADKEGRTWAYAYSLAQELGFTPGRAYQILKESGLPSIVGRSKSGAEISLYDADVARRILSASGYLERKASPRVTKVSFEETIRDLDPRNPQVIRDKGGRIRWTYPGNSDVQNQALGINNIQALFFHKLPKFNELFGRKDDGTITPELVEAAKAFIEDKIGTPEKFKEVMGISSDGLRSTPYFKAGLTDVLKKSFVALGIEFNEEEKVTQFTDINGNLEIEAVEQRSGIKGLEFFMKGQKPYEQVQPFILSDIPGNAKRGYHLTIYTYGDRAREGTATLSPNSGMKQLIIEGKQWYVFLNKILITSING